MKCLRFTATAGLAAVLAALLAGQPGAWAQQSGGDAPPDPPAIKAALAEALPGYPPHVRLPLTPEKS